MNSKELLRESQEQKIDYRVRFRIKMTPFERENLKARLYLIHPRNAQGIAANLFKTTRQNINIAFAGGNESLLNKLKSYIEKKESNGNGNGNN